LVSVIDVKYSIIIPTLNEEYLLPTLLLSLSDKQLKSKYDYEIIISDGGSTDDTLIQSRLYADKTLTFQNGDLKNISYGRHKGAVNAAGDILIFMNADVRIKEPYLFFEHIEKYFISSRFAAMTCAIKVFPELERLPDKLFSAFINVYVRVLNFIGIGMARGECQIVKKKIYNEIGGYNFNLFAGEDFELSTRLRKKGKILFSPEIVVYESPRRYHSWGYIRIIISWFMNSMTSWFLKKSVSKKWEPVR
jgi:glycosyltransferase involved in cell wall biosynthesis